MLSDPTQPAAEQVKRAFDKRCESLGVWAWRYAAGELSACENALMNASEPDTAPSLDALNRLEQVVGHKHPVDLDDHVHAVWLADPVDTQCGYILAARRDQTTPPGDHPAHLETAKLALAWTLEDLSHVGQSEYAVEDLTEQLGQCYENIAMLYDIGRSMRTIDQPKIIAQNICEQLLQSQDYGWSGIRMVAEDKGVPGMEDACLVVGEPGCDATLFRELTGLLLANWDERSWSKLLQPDRDALAEAVCGEVILEPIRLDGRVIGVMMAGGKTGPEAEATSGDTQLLDAIAGFLSTLSENAARLTEQKNMFIGSLQAVSAALDAKDRYTHGHSERVAWLGVQLAKAIGVDAKTTERIRISGLVHDVGKIGVPEAVLCKAGRLTDEEFEQIQKHPRIGYNILKGIPKMDDVLDGVLYHHERWDGRGYPTKLAGEDIPLYGRILAVADTFDAMSSTRSYRKAMPREKVLQEIRDCAGSQFDPALTDAFVALDFTEYDAMVTRHQGKQQEAAATDRAA